MISVTPSSGFSGDTVVIKGRYFADNPASCSVFFDDIEIKPESSTTEELVVTVPCSINGKMNIRVAIGGVLSSRTILFNLKTPTLYGFSPLSGTFGDIVTITGSRMPADTSCLEVFFNEARGKVTEVSENFCKVMVPSNNNVSPVKITFSCSESLNLTDKFNLDQAVITNVHPYTIISSQMITISGENFNPDPKMNLVEIGGRTAVVTNCNGREMTVSIPSGLDDGRYRVSVTTIAGLPVFWTGDLAVTKSVWSRVTDFPASGRVAAAGFEAGGMIYFGTGLEPELQTRNDFWEYNPVLDTWTRIEDFPTSPRFGACAAVVGSVAYIIGGYGGIYEQDVWVFLPR